MEAVHGWQGCQGAGIMLKVRGLIASDADKC